MKGTKPAIGFIFITLALDVVGFGLLIPVGPALVQSLLHGGRGGEDWEAAPYVAGLLTTWYAMSFAFAPVLGMLSDRVGRRPVILISLLGSGLDYFAQAFSPNLAVLFVTRAINGLSGASFTVASAYVADITPPEKRGAAFGMIGAAFGLGFVVGPALGGVLGKYDIHWPFYAAGGLTLLNAAFGAFVLPESLSKENRAAWAWKKANPIGAFANLTKYPLVFGMATALFLLNLAQFGLHATWALYTADRFGWDALHIGLSLTLVGVFGVVVQGFVARRLIPALGERRALMLGLGVGIAAYAAYASATQGWMIYVFVAFASLGGIAMPAAQSLITREVEPNEQGAIQGAITSLNSLAGIFGPLIGGAAFAMFTPDSAPVQIKGASLYAAAILAALGTVAASWALRHPSRAPSPASPSP